MRFHIGFSKRISWKWIIGAIGVIAAFFLGNHVALAASMSADATATYILSPYGTQRYCFDSSCSNYNEYTNGSLINDQSGTPYNVTWDSQRYSAFKTITSPYTAIGYRDNIYKARLRWTYATSDMNKCSSSQAITYTFKFFLRNITSGTLPQLWDTAGLYSKFWIRSSQTNYDCTVAEKDGHVITVNCTIPNPTATVYVYIENFTIPHLSVIDDGYYNVGSAPVQYTCGGTDTAAIINNNNSNTTQIIENNNNNTQQIIDSQQQINDSLTDDSVNSTTTNFANTIFGQDPFQNHGLQAIITAPISMLQGILNASTGTCQNLAVPVNLTGTETATYLPCGSLLWSRVPNTIEAIYQTTIYGFLVYFVLVDIVKTINNVIDPERKNDYVMDL